MLSVDVDESTLNPNLCIDLLVARLDELLLLDPEVKRLGVNLRMKSSMVFTGDFSKNRSLTLRRTKCTNEQTPKKSCTRILTLTVSLSISNQRIKFLWQQKVMVFVFWESKWTTLTQQQQKNLLELQNCMKAHMFVLKHFFLLSPPQIWLMDSLSILHHHHQQCILKATIYMKPCHPLCIFSEGSEKKVNAIFFCWEGWYLVEVKFNENMPMLKIFSEDNAAISNFPSLSALKHFASDASFISVQTNLFQRYSSINSNSIFIVIYIILLCNSVAFLKQQNWAFSKCFLGTKPHNFAD